MIKIIEYHRIRWLSFIYRSNIPPSAGFLIPTEMYPIRANPDR